MSKRSNDTVGEPRFPIDTSPEMMNPKQRAAVTIRSRRRLLVESLTHHFLSSAPEFTVVEFDDAHGAIEMPVVCILETGERPVEAAQRCRMVEEIGSSVPGGSILVLSGCRQEFDATDWLAVGAHGYCSTGSSLALLVGAVHVLAAGGIFLPAELAKRLLKRAEWAHAGN